MFEKKLEEAATQSRQKLFVLALICTIIGLVIVIALLFLSDNSLFKNTDQAASQTDNPASEEKKQVSGGSAPLEKNITAASQKYDRQEVITLIGRYEETLEPVILTDGFAVWNKSIQTDLKSQKDDVVGNLASGSIDTAYDQVIRLIESASVAVGDFEMAFDSAMTEAAASYDSDDIQGAQVNIDYALSLNSTYRATLELKKKIDTLPEILELIKLAAVAHTENNLEEEKRISEMIVERDPNRIFYRERITEIGTLLTERRFEQSIVRGLDANRVGNLTGLQTAHDEAKAIFPGREETKILAGMVAALKRKITFDNFIQKAGIAMQADDWNGALQGYENASAIFPNSKEVQDGLDMSRTILAHKKRIAGLMARPERLSNDSVKADALQAVGNAEVLGAISESLKLETEMLQKAVERWNQQIDILIVSDQFTFVSVKGVGKIGKVVSYKIQLKPGSYVLEGKREGFKTKLVPITVEPDDTTVEVEVITDERI
ncbi:MAG: hypothetical protein WDZ54_06130 [Sneathiella sp.]